MARVHVNGTPTQPRQLLVTPNNPSIGTDFSYTIPQGSGFILESMSFIVACNGTVANRFPRFRIKRGSTIYAGVVGQTVVTAGTATPTYWTRDVVGNSITATSFAAPMANLPPLRAGDILESFVLNLQTGGAGDQITTITMLFTLAQ